MEVSVMKKLFLMLLSALVLLGCCALAELPANLTEIEESAFEGDLSLTGVVTLPEGIQRVGVQAFAKTGVSGLIVPASCQEVGSLVLWKANADYLYLEGADTVLQGDPASVYVFAPAGSNASSMANIYYFPTESLTVVDGIYYTVGESSARPLCAVDRSQLGEVVTIPKLVNGKPISNLFYLCTDGWDNVKELRAPEYVAGTCSFPTTAYATITVSAPVPSVTECETWDAVTWTVDEVSGTYGKVDYVWTFRIGDREDILVTQEPTAAYAPPIEGVCYASVEVVDAANDFAVATAQAGVTVTQPEPRYRALLVGNIYAGTWDELAGCDTDVYAMTTVLNSMPGTDYEITRMIDASAGAIYNTLATTFKDARPGDVTLFYFSGHGTSSGALVGTGSSTISPSLLRSWLDAIPGTKIVIIDSCYSGAMIGKDEGSMNPASFNSAFISAFSSYSKGDNLASDGYIVMTACRQDQLSTSLTDGIISFGSFTYGVCYGSGFDEWDQVSLGYLPADANGDGAITLGEAYAGAVERVSWLSSLLNGGLEQAAQYYGDTSFVLWKK